jgi:hypothetical protein
VVGPGDTGCEVSCGLVAAGCYEDNKTVLSCYRGLLANKSVCTDNLDGIFCCLQLWEVTAQCSPSADGSMMKHN